MILDEDLEVEMRKFFCMYLWDHDGGDDDIAFCLLWWVGYELCVFVQLSALMAETTLLIAWSYT